MGCGIAGCARVAALGGVAVLVPPHRELQGGLDRAEAAAAAALEVAALASICMRGHVCNTGGGRVLGL
jgi:hypothetical protein